MKTITAIFVIALAAFTIQHFDLKVDPSGAITQAELKALGRDTLPQTGLVADPSGTAMVKMVKGRP